MSTGLVIGAVVVGGAVVAGAGKMYPELKRYLKIRSM
jgi:outer membrane murein-binding lipoprotein Lpp